MPAPGIPHRLARLGRLEIRQQLGDLPVEFLAHVPAAQRAHRERIGAGRAAQPQVDASRIKGFQRADLLGHDERRVVGQHDAPGAHADRAGVARDVPHQHDGRRARHAFEVVVLGDPVAQVAPALGGLGEEPRRLERARDRAALRIGGEVEDGEGCAAEPHLRALVVFPPARE